MAYQPIGDELTKHLTRTGFGELNVAENRGFVQATAAYNLIPSNFREYTSLSGTSGASNKLFWVSTGTTQYAHAAIQSFRGLNYKAGEGGLIRFTALFESNTANSWQGVGLIGIGDELSFGYNGTLFGIWHRTGGYPAVIQIQLTAPASGSENLSLTLNGVVLTIPLTSGTVQHNAYEIAKYINANDTGWDADQLNDTVILNALSDGVKNGTYTYSSNSSTGTITQLTEGVTKTSTFIPQSSWNIDTRPSLDPTKGNVYQIVYQYLGFGDIKFYIENPDSGNFELVHIIKYANANLTPSLTNPSMHVGMYAASVGSTTDLVVKSASIGAFMQGNETRTRNPRAYAYTQNISTTFESIIVLRNRKTYNGLKNQVEIQPLLVTVSNEGAKNAIVELRATTDTSVEQNFVSAGSSELVADVGLTGNNYTSGSLLTTFTIASGGSVIFNLDDLRIRIPPGLQLIVQARLTGGAAADISAALTWYEDL